MQHTSQAHQPATLQPAAQREARPASGSLSAHLAHSPRQLAQRRQLEGLRVEPVQRAENLAEEDEAGTAQLRAGPTQRQDNRTGMPDGLKAGIESLSGMDMSDVRVHRNSSQPAQLNALAYAQGNDIHLGPGQEQHLPHEAWHVVQQRQGLVQATMQMAGVGVNDDPGLESEADVMGGRAVQMIGGKRQDLTRDLSMAAQRRAIEGTFGSGTQRTNDGLGSSESPAQRNSSESSALPRADHPGSTHMAPLRPSDRKSGGGLSPVVQRVTKLEGKVGEMLGVGEGQPGWEVAEDVAAWFDAEQEQKFLDPHTIDIEQQTLIEQVCVAAGYHPTNANRLAMQKKYTKGDIYGQTSVKRSGFSLYVRDGTNSHDTQQIHSFPEDDLKPGQIHHQVYFRFLYSKEKDREWGRLMSQDYIARNPLLADFHTTDVIHEQLRFINNIAEDYDPDWESPFGPVHFNFERLHISEIINVDFLPWWRKQNLDLEDGYHELSEDVMDSFLTEISNGRLVKRVAEAAGKLIDGGGIRISQHGARFDLDFALIDKPEPEEEAQQAEQLQSSEATKLETQ